MSAQAPVPKDSPLMIAWEAYKATDEYANTRHWALKEAHVDGSLWAAFVEGFNSQSSKLSRWRIAASEVPTLEGEYIVARRRVGGGWHIDFDWFEPEATQFAHDDESMNPGGAKVVFWMPCPEFPVQLPEAPKP